MGSNVAVIDLGSNTFHILVCRLGEGVFYQVHRQRLFIGLAEGGITIINDNAIVRAREGFLAFQQIINNHNVDQVKIIGTAALRSASNAKVIEDLCLEILGHPIEIVNGGREAELIYKGVSQLADCQAGHHIIMDIGGGSTEFIVIKDGVPIWSKSYNIGVAVLYDMFHKSEPIALSEISELNSYLTTTLVELKEITSTLNIQQLIGASGSFEVVVTMNDSQLSAHEVMSYAIDDFADIAHEVIASDLTTRTEMPGMPASRVKLIVVAFLLMRYTLDLVKPKTIIVSPYALKEGVLSEML